LAAGWLVAAEFGVVAGDPGWWWLRTRGGSADRGWWRGLGVVAGCRAEVGLQSLWNRRLLQAMRHRQ
jgi:hypothetical protein